MGLAGWCSLTTPRQFMWPSFSSPHFWKTLKKKDVLSSAFQHSNPNLVLHNFSLDYNKSCIVRYISFRCLQTSVSYVAFLSCSYILGFIPLGDREGLVESQFLWRPFRISRIALYLAGSEVYTGFELVTRSELKTRGGFPLIRDGATDLPHICPVIWSIWFILSSRSRQFDSSAWALHG